MSAAPRVTVVMPAFNRERYIGAAIESVLSQRYSDFELLVIDDGSDDRSAEIACSYADSRIRVERNLQNLGIARTRNRALTLARGELLANLDSDDLAHPERLSAQVAFMDRHPEHAMIGSWAMRISRKGKARGLYRRPSECDEIRAQLLFRNCFKNTTLMLRREIALRYPYAEDLVVCEDVDLHVRIALDHPVANLPQPLCSYRRHGESLSRSEREETRSGEIRIAAAQLERLGVPYDDATLSLHHRLRSPKRMDFDEQELGRVESWLRRIDTAAGASKLYPNRALRRALARRWWQACRHAELPPSRRLIAFAASPLAAAFPAAAGRKLWERAQGRGD